MGGNELEVEGSGEKHYACNGATGFTKTLPSGETETGAYAQYALNGANTVLVPISFSIPLAAPLQFHSKEEEEHHEGVNQVHFILTNGEEMRQEVKEAQTACTGSAAEPKAAKGNLCVYEGYFSTSVTPVTFHNITLTIPLSLPQAFGADVTGTSYVFEKAASNEGVLDGSWAVTAP
jgi:hypothetical protein